MHLENYNEVKAHNGKLKTKISGLEREVKALRDLALDTNNLCGDYNYVSSLQKVDSRTIDNLKSALREEKDKGRKLSEELSLLKKSSKATRLR